MPARRRGQEAKRAERRIKREHQATPPLTPEQEVERAWVEWLNPWCCLDCDPGHPANTLNAALEEIETYREMPEEAKL